MIPMYNNFLLYPFLPPNCQKPPTLYTILESIVNPDVDLNNPAPTVKIKDLAKYGRSTIFNFDYPLTSNITKEKFETMILNHFLMRRIGFETVTAFRIQLDVKLNEIMPIYNKMFDAIENWNLFTSGETITKTGTDNRSENTTENGSDSNTQNSTESNTQNSTNNTQNSLTNSSTSSNNQVSDRRNSELPQNQLSDLRNGSYVTDYNYDQNSNNAQDSSTSNGTSSNAGHVEDSKSGQITNQGTNQKTGQRTENNQYSETVTRTPHDKIAIYKEFQENIKSIYSMILKDLDCLFYQLL